MIFRSLTEDQKGISLSKALRLFCNTHISVLDSSLNGRVGLMKCHNTKEGHYFSIEADFREIALFKTICMLLGEAMPLDTIKSVPREKYPELQDRKRSKKACFQAVQCALEWHGIVIPPDSRTPRKFWPWLKGAEISALEISEHPNRGQE